MILDSGDEWSLCCYLLAPVESMVISPADSTLIRREPLFVALDITL